jgi:hypothetical protein
VITTIVISIVVGLLANEVTDVSPWLAGKVARWSARLRYAADPNLAATRAEELTALINERPGNLFKLLTALGFGCSALAVTTRRALGEHPTATLIEALAAIVMALAEFLWNIAVFVVGVVSLIGSVVMVAGIAYLLAGAAFGPGFAQAGAIAAAVLYVAFFCISIYLEAREERLKDVTSGAAGSALPE